MKYLRALGLLIFAFSTALSIPTETSSSRSTPLSLEQHQPEANSQHATSNGPVIDVLDVRTPPKIKQELKLKQKEQGETFHPGIAIPIDDDSIVLEETTKMLNFYKIERPTTTTNNGLSTWILLSNTPTTRPPTRVSTARPKPTNSTNETLVLTDKPNRIAKPVFKKRTTTSKPSSTTKLVSTSSPTTINPPKLTKIKASVLNSAVNKKNTSTTTIVKKNNPPSTIKPLVSTTKIETSSVELNTTSNDSASLPAEAKETETELPSDDKKKNKKKKNKNRRRKPAADKQNKEDGTKLKEVQPVSTQLYSYLRSEIIPVTVGVSLVGLLVTAGLASYYLQPFGLLTRRNDPIDRKDNEGGYYYQDQYSGGIPEEDAIGKVIAGMPENSLTNDNYQTSTSRNSYPNNVRYRHVDRRSQIYMNPYGTVEDVKLDGGTNYAGAGYGAQQFVVRSVSKELIEEATPAAVPEHGPRNINGNEHRFVVGSIPDEQFRGGPSPRNLKIRRKRQMPDDADNEIITDDKLSDLSIPLRPTELPYPTQQTTDATTSQPAPLDSIHLNESTNALVDLFANLFRIKIKLGLEIIHNVTQGVSAYMSAVETRLKDYENTINHQNITKKLTHIRKRRQVLDTKENEIFPEGDTTVHHPKITEPFSNEDTANAHSPHDQSTKAAVTSAVAGGESTSGVSETGESTNNIMHISEKPTTLMDLLKDLFRLKLRVGLDLFQKVSRSVSSYVSSVQSRLNNYRHTDDSKPRR